MLPLARCQCARRGRRRRRQRRRTWMQAVVTLPLKAGIAYLDVEPSRGRGDSIGATVVGRGCTLAPETTTHHSILATTPAAMVVDTSGRPWYEISKGEQMTGFRASTDEWGR